MGVAEIERSPSFKHKELRTLNCVLPIAPPFPAYAGVAAMSADVVTAQSSRAEDRRAILHLIAGTEPSAQDQEPPVVHEGYDDLNRRIHARFSKLAMTHYCIVGDVARVEGL